jgi:pimeloyl-ACP methyl ester carboxylesterase
MMLTMHTMRGAAITLVAMVVGMRLGVALANDAVFAQSRSAPPDDRSFALAPCTAGQEQPAECGRISVLENRALPTGRRIDIHFIVVRSTTPGVKQAVFMFAGGPGAGSTTMVGAVRGWAKSLLAEQDVVFVDQRGTGQSNPLYCGPHAIDHPASAFGHVFDPAWLNACRADLETKADLTQYTTDAATEDVEAIRARLGYERVALYGQSYGTRMAQAYVRRHPDRVSAVVLDGVVPFDQVVPLTYARSAQQAMDRVLAACASDSACHAAHPHTANDVAAVLRLFAQGSVPVTVTTLAGKQVTARMSLGDFGYAVRGILYAGGGAITDLTDLFARAAARHDVSEFAQRYWERQAAMEGGVAFGMHLSVFCAEDVPFADRADIAAATDGTFLSRYLFDEYRAACAAWPRGSVASDARTPVAARVPVLLVSGAFDPVTPLAFAERVAHSLPLSRLIVAPDGGHGCATGCPLAAVLHVLAHHTFDGLPATCK